MIVLRPYQPEDLTILHAIDAACFGKPFRFSCATLRRFLHSRHAQTTVAQDASGIAGFITVHLESDTRLYGYIVTLDVLASHRRSGVGTQLMSEGERLARAAGASRMRLHVYTGNTAAQSFYSLLGYQQVSVVHDFYGDTLDALQLEKPLP